VVVELMSLEMLGATFAFWKTLNSKFENELYVITGPRFTVMRWFFGHLGLILT